MFPQTFKKQRKGHPLDIVVGSSEIKLLYMPWWSWKPCLCPHRIADCKFDIGQMTYEMHVLVKWIGTSTKKLQNDTIIIKSVQLPSPYYSSVGIATNRI
jgi:hypothetical protein